MNTIIASIIALLAACGVPPESDPPDTAKPPPTVIEENGQHFCCNTVDTAHATGEGCALIGSENINTCDKVLHCADTWTKDGGKVTCL